jgi:Ca-activated chloride channel family protein
VRLQAGFRARRGEEPPSHVKTEKVDDGRDHPARRRRRAGDRDFELTWNAGAEKAPSVGCSASMSATPIICSPMSRRRRSSRPTQKPLPRESIFVIDNSGSMGGTSIVQAKASLLTRSAACSRATAST